MKKQFSLFALFTIFFLIGLCFSNVATLEAKSHCQEICLQQPHHDSISQDHEQEFSATKPMGQPSGRTSQHEISTAVSSVANCSKMVVMPLALTIWVRSALQVFYATFSSSIPPSFFVVHQEHPPLQHVYLAFCNLRI